MRLDPQLAEAHASLGLIETNNFRWAPAEREFKRALELSPNYTNGLLWYSLLLQARNRLDDSLALMRKAVQIDPLSSIMVANLGARLNVIGKYDEALPEGQKAMELDPGYAPGYWQSGAAYEGLRLPQKAAAIYERAAAVAGGAPGFREAFLIRANMLRGNLAEAKKLVPVLERRALGGEVSNVVVGWAYSMTGDRDAAFKWLNRALDAREAGLRDNSRTIHLKELHGDPRYDALLRRLERGFDD